MVCEFSVSADEVVEAKTAEFPKLSPHFKNHTNETVGYQTNPQSYLLHSRIMRSTISSASKIGIPEPTRLRPNFMFTYFHYSETRRISECPLNFRAVKRNG